MKITREQVENVAVLARLELTEAETALFTGQMDAILAYVEKLNKLDTTGIVPTSHAVPMENAFRPDEVRPSIGTESALANAPERVEDFFSVPKVIE
jgi:aspartyl-tRNA(Asn)/glutamyl-tRNA(Gln) amidotransferase subunit C